MFLGVFKILCFKKNTALWVVCIFISFLCFLSPVASGLVFCSNFFLHLMVLYFSLLENYFHFKRDFTIQMGFDRSFFFQRFCVKKRISVGFVYFPFFISVSFVLLQVVSYFVQFLCTFWLYSIFSFLKILGCGWFVFLLIKANERKYDDLVDLHI